MMVRVLVFLFVLLAAPPALAQHSILLGMKDMEVCASRGVGEDLSDIDEASCRPVNRDRPAQSQDQLIWLRGRIAVPEGATETTPLGFNVGAVGARAVWW